MIIRESTELDLNELLAVEKQAFGESEGPEIVELVKGLFSDPTAKPLLSLLALREQQVAGHILFTKARIDSDNRVSAVILAPLAVAPDMQQQGFGGRLIAEGLKILAERRVELVFVLGHPDYYPLHGFRTAGILGFEAPYPIADRNADAWMVQELKPGYLGTVKGKVICAEAMDRPEYWCE